MAVAFIVGCAHGNIFRHVAFWRRAGLYIKNDEYRVGFFALTVIVTLYFLRVAQSYLQYHTSLREGFWPLIWGIIYCWGITAGFAHVKTPWNEHNVDSTSKDSAFSPLTGMRDE